jgi:hypothetical protein
MYMIHIFTSFYNLMGELKRASWPQVTCSGTITVLEIETNKGIVS